MSIKIQMVNVYRDTVCPLRNRLCLSVAVQYVGQDADYVHKLIIQYIHRDTDYVCLYMYSMSIRIQSVCQLRHSMSVEIQTVYISRYRLCMSVETQYGH